MSRTYVLYFEGNSTTPAIKCRDGKFRYGAWFGTYPECVHSYRREGNAVRFMNQQRRTGKYYAVTLPDGVEVDVSGNIDFPDYRTSFAQVVAGHESNSPIPDGIQVSERTK